MDVMKRVVFGVKGCRKAGSDRLLADLDVLVSYPCEEHMPLAWRVGQQSCIVCESVLIAQLLSPIPSTFVRGFMTC